MTLLLKKAPTLLVIGVTGFVAYTVLVPEGNSTPTKSETKPSPSNKGATTTTVEALRNPFQRKLAEDSESATTEVVAGPSSNDPAESVAKANSENPPTLAPVDDKILETMKLVGTFVDSRESLAIIDNKVYARGDSLRGVDGAALPYIVTEVHKDRALVRRGRREFIIAFSDAPRITASKPAAPVKSVNEKTEPKEKTVVKAQSGSTTTPSPGSVDAIVGKNDSPGAMKENGP